MAAEMLTCLGQGKVMEVVCGGAMAVGRGRDKAWKEEGKVRGSLMVWELGEQAGATAQRLAAVPDVCRSTACLSWKGEDG